MRPSYIIGPLVILLLSLGLGVYFYPLLPDELAYHFTLDGTPDGWLSREMTMFWMFVPQFVFFLLALGISWGAVWLSRKFGQTRGSGVEVIILFMGNLLAIPQLLLCFAMVNIFSYNLLQRHLMPIWAFFLLAFGLVTAALAIFLVYVFSRLRGGQRG